MGDPQSDTPAEIGFEGDVIIITGAGGGLGRSHALALASRGARIVVNDIGGSVNGEGNDNTPAQQVVKEIEAIGGEAIADYTNVADPTGGQVIVNAAIEAFGRVDGVVNNAGILRDGMHHKSSAAIDDLTLGVHLHGAFHVTRAALPHMREQGYGRIVVTTSAAGLFGNAGQANYAAAKLGLVGYMNALALEGANKGILVNAIAPVGDTRMTEGLLPEELLKEVTPENISAVVAMLMSRQCEITRTILTIAGRHVGQVKIGETIGWTSPVALTPEAVMANLDEITEDSQLSFHGTMTEAVMAAAGTLL